MAGASGTSSLAGEAVVVVVGAASLGGAASAAKGVPGLDATLLECLEFGVAGIPSPTPTLPIGVCAIAMVGSAATESLAAASLRSWAAFSLLNVAIVLVVGFTTDHTVLRVYVHGRVHGGVWELLGYFRPLQSAWSRQALMVGLLELGGKVTRTFPLSNLLRVRHTP